MFHRLSTFGRIDAHILVDNGAAYWYNTLNRYLFRFWRSQRMTQGPLITPSSFLQYRQLRGDDRRVEAESGPTGNTVQGLPVGFLVVLQDG